MWYNVVFTVWLFVCIEQSFEKKTLIKIVFYVNNNNIMRIYK